MCLYQIDKAIFVQTTDVKKDMKEEERISEMH